MIHQYKNNGYNIVLDVNSGSVHVVDDVVYDLIPLAEPLFVNTKEVQKEALLSAATALKDAYSADAIEEACDEIMELAAEEMLFTPDVYRDYIIDFKREVPW